MLGAAGDGARRGGQDARISFHSACTTYSNVVTDIRSAREAGYYGIELWIPKLLRYLDAGYTIDDLTAALGNLRVTMLDVLLPIETRDQGRRRELLDLCARVAPLAAQLRCDALQVVALDDFPSDDWATQSRILAGSLSELSDIAVDSGVRLALEPVSFSRFHSLEHAVELVETVGRDRVGLVMDTWHLWTGGVSWNDVSEVDPALICCAHLGDTEPKKGAVWSDDDRTALPGDGVLPLRDAIDAIRATGYDGVWSVEILGLRHREWDPAILAREMITRARGLLGEPPAATTGTND